MGLGPTPAAIWCGLAGLFTVAGSLVPGPAVGPSWRHVDGPPPAHTGGFGEPTCRSCHTEYEVNAPGGRLRVEGLPPSWDPGRTYTLSVVLDSEGMGAAGFQLAARTADGRPAGRFEAVDPRTAVDSVGNDTIPPAVYARHTRLGAEVSDPARASWAIAWTAPASGGPVSFHGAANSANGDDSALGDLIYTVNFSVGPADNER